MFKVYIKVDNKSRITAINSDYFLKDTTGWIYIDMGEGDKFRHAQNNYLPSSLYTSGGICRYEYKNGVVKERSLKAITTEFLEASKELSNSTVSPEERFEEIESAIIELAEIITTE